MRCGQSRGASFDGMRKAHPRLRTNLKKNNLDKREHPLPEPWPQAVSSVRQPCRGRLPHVFLLLALSHLKHGGLKWARCPGKLSPPFPPLHGMEWAEAPWAETPEVAFFPNPGLASFIPRRSPQKSVTPSPSPPVNQPTGWAHWPQVL